MTVTYIQHVPTAGKFCAFFRLLVLWKGGVGKSIWKDLVLYCMLYAAISTGYRYGLSQDEDVKVKFERMCVYCRKNGEYIPLSFILGFYVTQVVTRWWGQFTTLPWPDTLAMSLLSYLPGSGKQKSIRRLVVRWANLSNILTLRRLSTGITRRFPTFDHLVEAGLLTEREMEKLEDMLATTDALYPLFWVPLQWAQVEIRKARYAGYISSDIVFTKLQESLQDIEVKNQKLLGYGWMNIPLVYTQLVTIAVHVYFLVSLLGQQYLSPTHYINAGGNLTKVPPETPNSVNLSGHDYSAHDYFIPFFTILQFIFYFGWLKVAEILINPFGDDDDDFDVNFIVDRNFQTSYLMVNGSEDEDMDDEDDPYGNLIPPTTLPHTVASYKYREPAPSLPTDNMIVTEDDIAIAAGQDDTKHQVVKSRKLSTRSCCVALNNSEGQSQTEMKKRKQSLNLPRRKQSVYEAAGPFVIIDEATPLMAQAEFINK